MHFASGAAVTRHFATNWNWVFKGWIFLLKFQWVLPFHSSVCMTFFFLRYLLEDPSSANQSLRPDLQRKLWSLSGWIFVSPGASVDFAFRGERSLSCRRRAEQTQRLSHSVYQEVEPAHVTPEEKITSWLGPTVILELQRLSLRAENSGGGDTSGWLAASPLQPLQLQPPAEIFIMFDSCFTYENKQKSQASLHPSTPAGRHALGVPVSQEGRAGCRQRGVKKREYGCIMRRVILSDSRSDFIKVIIAERKHSTYKPPTPSRPHVPETLLIVAFHTKLRKERLDSCWWYNFNKESQRRKVASCFYKINLLLSYFWTMFQTLQESYRGDSTLKAQHASVCTLGWIRLNQGPERKQQ